METPRQVEVGGLVGVLRDTGGRGGIRKTSHPIPSPPPPCSPEVQTGSQLLGCKQASDAVVFVETEAEVTREIPSQRSESFQIK